MCSNISRHLYVICLTRQELTRVARANIVSSIFIGQSGNSDQSGLMLQLFPLETIVTLNLIDQNDPSGLMLQLSLLETIVTSNLIGKNHH